MIEIELKSKELKEDVYIKLNKDRNIPIYDEDLEKIEYLALNGLDFLDEPTDMTIFDLVFFKKLKDCCLINMTISEAELNLLNQLENLQTLQLTNCKFPENKQLTNNLKSLVLDRCEDVKITNYNKIKTLNKLRIVNCNKVDIRGISEYQNLSKLYLQNLELGDIQEIQQIKKLQYLNINGTKVENKEDLKNNQNIIVVDEDKNYIFDEED